MKHTIQLVLLLNRVVRELEGLGKPRDGRVKLSWPNHKIPGTRSTVIEVAGPVLRWAWMTCERLALKRSSEVASTKKSLGTVTGIMKLAKSDFHRI